MAPPTIHPDRLFNGDRLADCSPRAQLYYPRIVLASNGYGRIEIDPARIIDHAFRTFKPKDRPSEQEIADVMAEYYKHFLLFLYGADGQMWGQFDIPDNLLPHKKTAADERSPAPDKKKFAAFKAKYQALKTNKCKATSGLRALIFEGETDSGEVRRGSERLGEVGAGPVVVVGVGVDEVVGVVEEKPLASHPADAQRAVIKFPLNDGSEFDVTQDYAMEMAALYPAVNVGQELRNMRAWLLSNQQKRKTRTGIKRFINSWLSDKQNKAPRESNHGQVTKAQRNQDDTHDAIREAVERRRAGRMAGGADGGYAPSLPQPSTDTRDGGRLPDGLGNAGEAVRPEVIPAGSGSGANGVRVLSIRRSDQEGD